MSNSTFRVGLAGLSWADTRHVLPALVGLDGQRAALVAVADLDADSAQSHLAMLGTSAGRNAAIEAGHALRPDFAPDAVQISDNAEMMVMRSDLDGVVIAAGADRPAELAALALHHGRDVLLVAPSALADEDKLTYLSGVGRAFDRTLWPEHPSAVQRPELVGSVTGACGVWHLPDASHAAPTKAERLLWLTTPLAAFLDPRTLHRTDVAITGGGAERTVRVGWVTAADQRVEAEVRFGWPFGAEDEARITLYGTGGQAVLPLAAPGATAEPTPAALRGVLRHPERGPFSLQPPRRPAEAHRALVTDWVEACRAQRPERAPVSHAIAAARMATDLAKALSQD